METASWARRVLALVLDWAACLLAVSLFTPVYGQDSTAGSTWTLVVYVLEASIFTSLVGGSFGQVASRLRVVSVRPGRRPGGRCRCCPAWPGTSWSPW